MKQYTISILIFLTFFLTKAVMNTIAIIPAAGFGTRFLPFTKIIPKELVPVNGIPTIDYILGECIESGINDVCIIANAHKRALIEYCAHSQVVDNFLKQVGKTALLEKHYKNIDAINFTFAYQEEAKGLGHAISCAKKHAEGALVAVLLPDDIMTNQEAVGQMVKLAQEHSASVIAVQRVPLEKVSHYGIVALKGEFNADQIAPITDIIEKPSPRETPSQYAVIGRYVLQPEIFAMLEQIKPGKNGEFQLTDAIALLIEKGYSVIAYEYDGIRFDVGNPQGFLEANNYYTPFE